MGSGVLGSMTWLSFSLSPRKIEFFVSRFLYWHLEGHWALLCGLRTNYSALYYSEKISSVFLCYSIIQGKMDNYINSK